MIDKNNIPQGYKDSVVGIIPQEWEVKKIQDICNVDSKSLSSKTPMDYEFEYISLSDVDSDSFEISTSHQIFRTAPSRARRIVTKGDVVVSTVRPNLKGFFIVKEDKKDLIASTGFAVLTPKESNSEYLLSCFFSQIIGKQFYSLVVGSSYPAVNSSDVARLKLPLPPLAEQKKIAEILCTWDDAIEKQSKLIEKLELRKRGLMQRLLTGKTRLPGFTEPWINIRIGELCLMKRGEILVSDDYILGDIPVVAGGKEPAGFHNVSNRNGNIITISSSGASAGFVAFYEKPIFATDCFTISSSEKYNVRFFYYYLMMSQERIYRLQSGGAQPHVHPKDLAPMMLRIPSLEEQNAVVKIILSSDKEIEIQRKKLEALRQQKRGLMQQLLTGKTRVKVS